MDVQNTNLEAVKKVAEMLLEEKQLEVDKSDKTRIIHHPFFKQTIYPVYNPEGAITICCLVDGAEVERTSSEVSVNINIIEYPEGLKKAKEKVRDNIYETDSVFGIFSLVTKGYRFAFLALVLNCLSRNDLSEILRYLWGNGETTSRYNSFSIPQLVKLFKSCNPEVLMNEDEYEYYQNLPDELTIYRGILETDEKDIYCLSWTLNLEKAIWFANRFPTHGNEERAVYEAKIKKKDVLACFSIGDEDEIVVNPKKLYDVKRLQNIELRANYTC